MRCTDCGGGVPAPLWQRCERCAYERLRRIVDPLLPAKATEARRYKKGDRIVWVHGPPRKGRVVRHPDRLGNCVLEDESGERFYANVVELRADDATVG